jgi:ectoine hydroxylase-related dioxygenase (phytanoyl-CoA dioxygenase family)
MIEFFETFLSSSVRHYDYTWFRQRWPGVGTRLHSDVVYMGRGTHRLYTAWTPMGDNDFSLGGLLMLEGSNHHAGLAKKYWKSDVDAYCQNKEDKRDGWQKSGGGWLKGTAEQIRQSLGCDRWVTANYRMGDVVIFHIYTLHGSTDNVSDRIRISTDTRYQAADQAVDERWIGAEPVAHGPAAKRGVIC